MSDFKFQIGQKVFTRGMAIDMVCIRRKTIVERSFRETEKEQSKGIIKETMCVTMYVTEDGNKWREDELFASHFDALSTAWPWTGWGAERALGREKAASGRVQAGGQATPADDAIAQQRAQYQQNKVGGTLSGTFDQMSTENDKASNIAIVATAKEGTFTFTPRKGGPL